MSVNQGIDALLPSAISALSAGTSAALAGFVVLRDRRLRGRSEADKTIVWSEFRTAREITIGRDRVEETRPRLVEALIRLHNRSEYPIFNALVVGRRMTKREAKAHCRAKGLDLPEADWRDIALFRHRLENEEQPDVLIEMEMQSNTKAMYRAIPDSVPSPDFHCYWVSFTDYAGKKWIRDARTAELRPLNSRATRRDLRGRRIWRWWEYSFRLMFDLHVPWHSKPVIHLLDQKRKPRP